MSDKLVGTPETAYVTVPNILYPGPLTAAAAATRAQDRQNDRWADVDGVSIAVTAAAVELET